VRVPPEHPGLVPLLALLGAVSCASRERYLARLEVVKEVDAAARAWKGEAARLAARPGERIDWTEVEVLDADARGAPIPAQARVTSGITRPDGSRATREQAFEIELRRSALDGRLELIAGRETERDEAALPAPWFADVTESAGLLDRHRPALRPTGSNRIVRGEEPASGAAALDYDGDGWTDLFCADGVASILYGNRGDGTFAERTDAAGLGLVTGHGVACADVDGDGRPDLVVLDHFAPARIFRNAGARFDEVTAGCRLRIEGHATSAAFADVDVDGDLDLYVCRSGDYAGALPNPPFAARNGEPNALFLNQGDGTFADGTAGARVGEEGWSLACAFADLDDDGAPDLYVANDFGRNALFMNRGDGRFAEKARAAGAQDTGFGMGVGVGDCDGDGDLDLYVSNIHSPYGFLFKDPDLPLPLLGRIFRGFSQRMLLKMARGNTLLQNDGHGRFEDASEEAGVARAGWAWSGDFVDADADGDLDLFVPNGLLAGSGDARLDFWGGVIAVWDERATGGVVFDPAGRGLHGDERKRLFENRGDGTFREVGYPAGVADRRIGRCLLVADFDRDGFPDLYLRNARDRGTLYRNVGNGNRRLALRLEGTRSPRDAVGARVTVETSKGRQVREARAGNAFLGAHDRTLLVGLGTEGSARVRVRWPSGLEEDLGELPAGAEWRVVEGEARARPGAPFATRAAP
jgi:hypothetical protein